MYSRLCWGLLDPFATSLLWPFQPFRPWLGQGLPYLEHSVRRTNTGDYLEGTQELDTVFNVEIKSIIRKNNFKLKCCVTFVCKIPFECCVCLCLVCMYLINVYELSYTVLKNVLRVWTFGRRSLSRRATSAGVAEFQIWYSITLFSSSSVCRAVATGAGCSPIIHGIESLAS